MILVSSLKCFGEYQSAGRIVLAPLLRISRFGRKEQQSCRTEGITLY